MRQRWAGLGFFHWHIDQEFISSRLPDGLHVDTFEGKAWLGIVPFFMQRIRPVGLPPLPWLSWFHELNVRTYVFDENGNPGVWFFSLDCNQPIAVEIARKFFNLPYQHAVMSSDRTSEGISYRSERKKDSGRTAEFHYPLPSKPQPAVKGSLEWFLLERYLLYSADRNRNLYTGRVHHNPYLFSNIPSATCSTLPFSLNNFPEPSDPPVSMLATLPVDVTVYPLRRL